MAALTGSSTNAAKRDGPQVVNTRSLEVFKRRLNEDVHFTNVRASTEIIC